MLFSSCNDCESMNDAAVAPDSDIECCRFLLISARDARNRRIIIPEWRLEQPDLVLPPELPPLELGVEITV
jgi:hypothetical protein